MIVASFFLAAALMVSAAPTMLFLHSASNRRKFVAGSIGKIMDQVDVLSSNLKLTAAAVAILLVPLQTFRQ